MKKLVLFFALLGGFALTTAQAQHCAGKTKAAQTKVETGDQSATAHAAALQDPAIEIRKDAESGEVSYVRKEVCQESGKVSYASVEYCSKSAKFVAAQAGSCSKSAEASKVAQTDATDKSAPAASCCSKDAKVAESSCCSTAQKAACSKASMKTESIKTEDNKKVKLTKSGA